MKSKPVKSDKIAIGINLKSKPSWGGSKGFADEWKDKYVSVKQNYPIVQ